MALIVGHSQVKYMFQSLSDDRVFSLCYSGYKCADLIQESGFLDAIPHLMSVALVIGANDVPTQCSEEVFEGIKNLCDTIHHINTSTKVFVAEVLPRAMSLFPGKKPTASFLRRVNSTALDVNRRLLQLQVDCEWVRVVTFPEFVKSGSPNRSLLSKDGLHLSPQGSRLVATRLEHHLQNTLTARIAERVDDDEHSVPVGPLLFSQVVSLCPAVTITTVDVAVDTDIISSTFDSVPNLVLSADRVQCKPQKQPPRIVKKERPQKTRRICAQTAKSPDTYIADINRYAVLPVQRCKSVLIEGSQKKRRPRTATPSSPASMTPPTTTTSPTPPSTTLSPMTPPTTTTTSPTPPSTTLSPMTPPTTTTTSPTPPSTTLSPMTPPTTTTTSPTPPSTTLSPMTPPTTTTSSPTPPSTTLSPMTPPTTTSEVTLSSQTGGALEEPIVFTTSTNAFSANKARDILFSVENNLDKVSNVVPVKPKGGEIYIIDTSSLPNKKDFLFDRYFWRNNGCKKYPKNSKDPYISKTIFHIRDNDDKKGYSGKFQKHVYQLLADDRFKLIHYIGDESLVSPVPHGNSKTGKEFVPTKPSVLEKIKDNAENLSNTASTVHKELFNEIKTGTDVGLNVPRNRSQVAYHLYKERREKRITQDDIYNLLEISYHTETYVSQIDIFPWLVCVVGMPEIMDFAISFLVDICLNNYNFDINIRYKIPEMRSHLLSCIEKGEISPFPRVEKMPKMPSKETRSQKVSLFCTCRLPDCIDNLRKCSNKKCNIKWFHEVCISGFYHDDWLCKSCR